MDFGVVENSGLGAIPGAAGTGPSIAENVKSCMRSFESLCTALRDPFEQGSDTSGQISLDWTKNTLDRFKLWSQNIGAHHTGRRSLDFRLRDASSLRKQAINLVGDMDQAVNDAIAIISGKKVPWDKQPSSDADEFDNMSLSSGEDDSTYDAQNQATGDRPSIAVDSELTQIMLSIIDIIDCLIRLSISVQNPAPHDRFKASTFADVAYERSDIDHVRAKFCSATEKLAERLGKANSRRRQYFRYRETHHNKLASGLEANMHAGQSTVASSIPMHLKTTNISGDTAAFGLLDEDQRSDTGYSQTSYATSTTGTEASGRLRVPNIPEAHSKGPFECPFCFVMISVSTQSAWKKHVFSDLRPYVCLEASCKTPHEDYPRRHKWFSHLVQAHWRVWPCPLNCEEEMTSSDALKNHLLQAHNQSLQPDDINILVQPSARKSAKVTKTMCPLCRQVLSSTKMYMKHVGRHQEDLALFALPKLDVFDEDGNEEDESVSDKQDVGYGDSLYSDTDHDSDTASRVVENARIVRRRAAGELARDWPTEQEQRTPKSNDEIHMNARSETITENEFLIAQAPDLALPAMKKQLEEMKADRKKAEEAQARAKLEKEIREQEERRFRDRIEVEVAKIGDEAVAKRRIEEARKAEDERRRIEAELKAQAAREERERIEKEYKAEADRAGEIAKTLAETECDAKEKYEEAIIKAEE